MRRRNWWSSLLAAGMLLLGAVIVHAQETGPLPEVAYWELVSRTHEVVASADKLDAISAEWENLDAILLEDGRIMPIDTSYLAGLLSAEPIDRTTIIGTLDALEATASTWRLRAANPAAADDLEIVLSRSEFDYSPQPPSLWATLWQRLRELLFGSETMDAFARLLAGIWPVIAVAVIFGVAIYVVRSFLTQFARQADLAGDDPYVPNLTVASARTRATERATDGDYRDAVRYLYLAMLLHLDEQGVLDYDRTRTNYEYVRSVRDNPAVAADLQAVVRVFDETWYGFHALSATAYATYAARINALVDGENTPIAEGVA